MEHNSITHQDASKVFNSEQVDQSMIHHPTLIRWYVDIRRWEDQGLDLPLVHTLTQSDQEAVKRYFHASDKRMSLASQLLKYYFVHQTTGANWDEIEIQRTPAPEKRPFYDASLDFNVSHQAGITLLAGTRVAKSATSGANSLPRVGVDIACVDEPSRRRANRPPKTFAELATFVDVFEEVLSYNELQTIKNPLKTVRLAHPLGMTKIDPNDHNEELLAGYGLRLFYSIWALKEAYLKMTGDGLIAPWIKELEFSNVIPPSLAPPQDLCQPDQATHAAFAIAPSVQSWGPPYSDIKVTLKGKVVDHVRLQLVAFENDYIVATAASGPNIGAVSKDIVNKDDHHLPGYISVLDPAHGSKNIRIAPVAGRDIGDRDPWRVHSAISDPWLSMQEVNIDIDIRPCAEGRCSHPQNPHSVFAYVYLRWTFH
ncbi:hypothetical protein N7452_010095 [Penicillium brevicompactum]|uniref:holo-[acyl-carrier-protein] synthase n=1 Tax=Penicillium brevicompactum TaxID=5074 RepID=A0A9W9UCZ1_PENBR|nr:hypothetical protein N7452_010095 [Penicillium brevicompactum]